MLKKIGADMSNREQSLRVVTLSEEELLKLVKRLEERLESAERLLKYCKIFVIYYIMFG